MKNKRGQIQPAVQTQNQTPQTIAQPSQEAPKDPLSQAFSQNTSQVTDVNAKKSKWWLWILLTLLILIGAGIAVFYFLSS